MLVRAFPLILMVLALEVGALGAAASASQGEFLIRKWTTDEGLPQNTVTSIVQTSDGYIWLGTFGGLTPKGIASPHYKHGRYSRHLPKQLRDRYYESLNEPEITALRDDLTLIDIHISEVLMEMHSPSADDHTKLFRHKIKLCRQGLLECDPASKLIFDVVELLDELDAAIENGACTTGDFS